MLTFAADKDGLQSRTSIYEDLQDFYSGSYDFTEEHLATVLEYFKIRKPELYEKYMDGVTFYLDGI